MENKEIYIDDVDVSGCIYFKMNNKTPMCRACNSGVGSPYCEYHKDCYYKQLKEKEKECEELEKLYKELQDDMLACNKCRATIKLQQQLDQLKADNDELQEEKQGLIKDWEEKKNLAYEIACENEKLKQTLTEIKEIVRQEIVCDDCNFQGTDKCDSRLCTSFYLDDFCKSLLQKISECEVK